MSVPAPVITPEEYLERERSSEVRHEYVNGHVYAMAGASRAHRLISLNVASSLSRQLEDGPCETYVSDARVRVTETAMFTYPDVVVACEPVLEDGLDTVLNPRVLVEVLSPSTESHDRGDKFEHYKRLPSLTDYLLVAQDRPVIEHLCRAGDQWVLTVITGRDAVLSLESVGCELPLSQVYQRVPFADDSTSE